MITREQYETAKSVLLEYQSQLRVEAEYIGGILSKDVDAVSTASFLSELEAGDKCIISAIQRHKPSLKKGDIMKVLNIEKKYKNGRFSCKVWLKNENTGNRLSGPADIKIYNLEQDDVSMFYNILISKCPST